MALYVSRQSVLDSNMIYEETLTEMHMELIVLPLG